MNAHAGPQPPPPVLTAHLFGDLGEHLLALLRGLRHADWARPTVCPQWDVKDIAAHLLDTALRRLSFERDRLQPPEPARPIHSERDLVAHLNDLNGSWVAACRRLSPAVLIELMEVAERDCAAHMRSLDPNGRALFAVGWAGEEESQSWFDVARELTERWHHQQQIRLATGSAPLLEPRFSRPVFETFARALPRFYSELEAPAGTELVFAVQGSERYAFTLRRDAAKWNLLLGEAERPAASISLPEEAGWRLLTNSLQGPAARAAATTSGPESLIAPLFATRAVMV
jgi:uncharacterized protein (TIGR03083 family)